MSEGPREARHLAIFLSYSRDDLDFADQLDAALQSHKYDVAIDRHGISGGEDWKSRLGGLIRDADTVVFVLSSSSARSEICKWEVEEASRLGKRIIPVVCGPLDGAGVPPQVSALNYIFFYPEPRSPGSGFGTGLARLVLALNTDLDWLREHTRLLQRASEWSAAGRSQSRLLFGDSIAEAKAWVARRPKDGPEPTALHYEFIRASEETEARRQDTERQQLEQMAAVQADRAKALAEREEAQKREAEQTRRLVRRTLVAMAVVILFALAAGVAGIIAFRKQQEASAERDRARHALARVFAERSWSSLSSGNRDLAIRYALVGWRVAPSNAAYYRAPLAQALVSPIVPVSRQLHQQRINTLTSSWDGKYLTSGGEDALAVYLEISSVRPVHQFRHHAAVTAAAIDPSGRRVLTISDDTTLHIWDTQTGDKLVQLKGHADDITTASFSPDASRLVSASRDKTANLWDLRTGRILARLRGHDDAVSASAFSPDGARVVTASGDGTARTWDAATGKELAILRGHTDDVTAIAFSPDGRLLLTGSADRTVRIWDASEGFDLGTLAGHADGIRAVSLSSDGSKAYVIDFDGNAYIWDMKTLRIIVASPSATGGSGLASFTSNGTYAAISDKRGGLRIWDADAARTVMELRGSNSAPVSAMLWAGTNLFVGDESGGLSVYDLAAVTQSIAQLISRACAKERALSPRFTWMESAADPLIREIWDPGGTDRPVCE